MSEQVEYEVLVDGEIMHRHLKAGEKIMLHPAQAVYYLRDGRLREVKAGSKKGSGEK